MLRFITVILFTAVPLSIRAQDPAFKDVWVYKQNTGDLSLNGKVVGKGYSGNGKGINNSELEKEKDTGPIPRGEYAISDAFRHETKGPITMRLTPVGHKAQGRTGFMIHGDNSKADKSASNGCIILGPELRTMISTSQFKRLMVTK